MNARDAAAIIKYVEARLELQEFLTGRRLTIRPVTVYQAAFDDADRKANAAMAALTEEPK